MLALLRAGGDRPAVASAARALSHAGEHAALWLAAGLTGAAVDPARRPAWLRATAVVVGAHLAGMAVKQVVRRPRPPAYEGRGALVRTAGRHSFPSCHAASATAAAFAFGALRPGSGTPGPGTAPAVVAAAMCVSRVVAGVHYPSDVVAGALIGGLTARAAAGRAPGIRTALTRPGRPQ
ncbi:phosphatase PAP2 family protein [Streptomyces sp. NPDC006798]|uniref:phosphatase PAP2 family protein n=1 Tax=Streptomyces sp. NPDC006798 TaxID=3155462 RepID=UPI0033D0F246